MKLPRWKLPSAMTVFMLVLLSYFLIVSGVIYDVIVKPPGIGSKQDPITGAMQPVVFLPGRVNAQYIIEGLAAGFMFVLGGVGLIMIDLGCERSRASNVRLALIGAGAGCVFVSYTMSTLFLRIKIPSYMR